MKIKKLSEAMNNVPDVKVDSVTNYEADLPYEMADAKIDDEKMWADNKQFLDAKEREKKPFLGAKKQPLPKDVITAPSQIKEGLLKESSGTQMTVYTNFAVHGWQGDMGMQFACANSLEEGKLIAKFFVNTLGCDNATVEDPATGETLAVAGNAEITRGDGTKVPKIESMCESDDVELIFDDEYGDEIEEDTIEYSLLDCDNDSESKMAYVEQALKECGFDELLDELEDKLIFINNDESEDEIFQYYLDMCNRA